MKNKSKFLLHLIFLLWFIAYLGFWVWFINPRHVVNFPGFFVTSLIFWWNFIVFSYAFVTSLKITRVKRFAGKPHKKLRVAMITTKVPSEPLDLVQRTLLAILRQKYPHDTWILDENPSEEAMNWYKKHNIYISTRRDDPKYHNETWPRKAKSKEGNLAYFYDKWGYKNYDIVAQVDADHVPSKRYLSKIVEAFCDPEVGYVAAPSIGSRNLKKSWAARARAYSEALFHGPMQAGAGYFSVPICIGSHYAVRTKALKNIGGIGPDLAEDYSTSLLMQTHKWKGAWAYGAHAIGYGPETFADLIVQDYQWSRSMFRLFLTFSMKKWMKLNTRAKVHFIFTQLWYPLTTMSFIAGIVLSFIVCLTGTPAIDTKFSEFIIIYGAQYIFALLYIYCFQKYKYLRPKSAAIISYEVALFELARWPWIVRAHIDAIVSIFTGKIPKIVVTPKNAEASIFPSMRVFYPYLFIAGVSIIVSLLSKTNSEVFGYRLFVLLVALSNLLLCFVITILQFVETKGYIYIYDLLKSILRKQKSFLLKDSVFS